MDCASRSSIPSSRRGPLDALPDLPSDWRELLSEELAAPYFAALASFVDRERNAGPVFPAPAEVFRAFELTPLTRLRVVLLGQDPYHGPGQAHGLSFSVPRPLAPPPSLANMLRERETDLALPPPDHGELTAWAQRGVLLLNTVLTVRAHEALSHRGQGWERFTDAVVARIAARRTPVVFLLWGAAARAKSRWIDRRLHAVLEAAHPSPLSAHRGFLGSRPYSRANSALQSFGHPPVDWSLP